MSQRIKGGSEAPTPADTREQQFHAIIALQDRVADLEAALREMYGSYKALANYPHVRDEVLSDPMEWDGPICARRALGIES